MARKSDTTSRNNTVDRRRFIKSAAAGAVAATAAGSIPRRIFAATQKKITFTLPWLPNGSSLFVYVAKDKGFWPKLGIDATISRGFGSVASAQAVGQGKFDFGLSAAPANYLQIVKGMKIMNLGCCTYDPAMGVMFLETSGIKTPKDLENTKMACVVASGEYPFLPVFAKRAGFDLSKVTIIQVDNKIRTSVMLSGRAQSMSGFAGSDLPALLARGYPARVFLYSSYGMPFYGQMLITQPAMLEKDKGLCEAVTHGAMEAIKWTMLNVEEAQKIFFNNVKEAALTKSGRKALSLTMGLFTHINMTPEVEKHGVGYIDGATYEGMTKLILDALAKPGDKPPPLASVYTNEFVKDQVMFTPAEVAQIKEFAKPYAKLLS